MREERKKYEKPSMKVYELSQQPQILVGSPGNATISDYVWEDYKEY